jgi:PAS domain-containing protein
MVPTVIRDPALAAWLVVRRRDIDRVFAQRLGVATPRAAAPESEALRRFRVFAAGSLEDGAPKAPALDGLRVDEARVGQLLTCWCDAAAEIAGDGGAGVRHALAPLVALFRTALRATAPEREKSGVPRANRRAVVAAIDRVADVFLALDTADGRIVDANPAAGAFFRATRDGLVDTDALRFVPEAEQPRWWTEFEAVSEGSEPRRFRTRLRDGGGIETGVEASVTRFATRDRTLALFIMRLD